MKRALLHALTVMSFCAGPAFAEDSPKENLKKEMNELYDCTWKLSRANGDYNIDRDLSFINSEFFYILDRRKRDLYLYTPYFAGIADLSHDKEGMQMEFPKNVPEGTTSLSGNHEYDVRLPYFPDDSGKKPGYYYVSFSDSVEIEYGTLTYLNGKPDFKKVTPPRLVGEHDARSFGIPRFLPGDPQKIPDFRHRKTGATETGITIISVAGQKNDGVEYHPLNVEDRLWDKNAHDNFSLEARDVLVSDIIWRMNTLPSEHKVGDGSGCEGHLGCNWNYSEEMIADQHKRRMDAIAPCKAAAEEFHLDIFQPPEQAVPGKK